VSDWASAAAAAGAAAVAVAVANIINWAGNFWILCNSVEEAIQIFQGLSGVLYSHLHLR